MNECLEAGAMVMPMVAHGWKPLLQNRTELGFLQPGDSPRLAFFSHSGPQSPRQRQINEQPDDPPAHGQHEKNLPARPPFGPMHPLIGTCVIFEVSGHCS